jgi:hypothetical protein
LLLGLWACGDDGAVSDAAVDGTIDGGGDSAVGDSGPGDGDAGPACPGLTTLCGTDCVVTAVDPDNCGGCGVVCGPMEACVSNGCVGSCPPGLTMCDRTCVDTATDNAHCGGCGMACADGEGCMGGCVPSVPLDPPPARCEGGGPPIVIRDAPAAPGTCADRTAAISFTWGICSCNDIGLPRLSSETEIDAYDSSAGPYMAGGTGGGMAANGRITTSELAVSGSIHVSGTGGLESANTQIDQEVRAADDLTTAETTRIGEDAWVGGELSGTIEITGDLHVPDCGGVPGDVTSASCIAEAVSVPAPCACDAADLIPIGDIVDFYAMPANNDNMTVSLLPDVFTTSGGPRRLDLPCGYYHLDAIEGAVTIAAHGRTALFISGNVEAGSAMAFVVDPGATLDVYVAGTLSASASLRVGSPAYPRNVRFYVGGVDTSFDPPRSVDLTSDVDLAGLFYAPNGVVSSTSSLEMYGSIFAGDFHNTASTTIHYDAAAATLGADCPDPPPSGCTSCRDCGNQACIAGECASCTDSSECCAPLRCVDGSCVPPLF